PSGELTDSFLPRFDETVPRGCSPLPLLDALPIFGFDIPQSGINCCQCCHTDRAATPVSTTIKELPDVLNLMRIAADKRRNQVMLQIGNHRFFASVECSVTDAINSFIRHDFQRDKISAR